jgi:hypothetical protein
MEELASIAGPPNLPVVASADPTSATLALFNNISSALYEASGSVDFNTILDGMGVETTHPAKFYYGLFVQCIDRIPEARQRIAFEALSQSAVHMLHKSEDAIQTALSRLRKALALAGKYSILPLFQKYGVVMSGRQRRTRHLRQVAAVTNLVRKVATRMYDYGDIMKFFVECDAGSEWWHHYSVVMLSTGARLVEVMRATFLKADVPHGRRGDWIVQDYLAKKTGDDQTNIVIKPLILVTFERLAYHHQQIKTYFIGKSTLQPERIGDNRLLENSTQRTLNKFITKWWTTQAPATFRTTSHKLRSLYACIAYQLYKSRGEPQQAFFRNVLGHEDFDTAIYYSTVSTDVLRGTS